MVTSSDGRKWVFRGQGQALKAYNPQATVIGDRWWRQWYWRVLQQTKFEAKCRKIKIEQLLSFST